MDKTNNPRFIIPMSMAYCITCILSSILVNKFINIGGHFASAGSFTMPFWFVLSDIITEVYGYRVSRRMLWSLLVLSIFVYSYLELFSLIQPLQKPSGPAYHFVFGSMIRIYFGAWSSLFFANFLNTYLLVKLKILMRSRYFWLRSICSSGLGEVVYTVIGFYAILGMCWPFY